MNEFEFRSLKSTETSPSVRRIWRITLTIVMTLVAFLFLPWQQTVKGQGTLIAYRPDERIQPVSATIDGFVKTFHAGEDEYVTQGDPLFSMVDLDERYAERAEAMAAQLREQLQNTRNETDVLEANRKNAEQQRAIGLRLFAQRIEQAKDRLESLRLKRMALQKRLETEKANFERVSKLYEEAIESRRVFERADAAFVQAQTERDKIEVDIAVGQRALDILKEEKTQFANEADNRIRTLQKEVLAAQSRTSALERERQQQMTTIARYGTSDVRAEKNGYVIRMLVNDKNRFIRQGEPVLQFAPDVTERALLLKVSDFNMPLIQEGLPVRIMFYGWPALQISGWPAIRFGTFGGIIKKVDPVSYEHGFYYAYVVEDPREPWPEETKLRRGTQATAWVALETVPVWYQLWRLMNAMPPKMVVPEEREE